MHTFCDPAELHTPAVEPADVILRVFQNEPVYVFQNEPKRTKPVCSKLSQLVCSKMSLLPLNWD